MTRQTDKAAWSTPRLEELRMAHTAGGAAGNLETLDSLGNKNKQAPAS